MKEKAVTMLNDGTVKKVIGWKKGDFAYDITPAVFETAEEIESGFVYDDFCVSYPNVKTIIQEQGMTPEMRDEYLSRFNKNPKETLIAVALCGGIFSEGVDLTGDRLSGAIIVGTGLPGLSFERDMLKEHLDKTIGEGLGYNYAYTYTGLNRVYQAGGRVIRTKDDKGFVVLADDRYSKISHRRTFPTAWKNDVKMLLSPSALEKTVKDFWKS